MHIKYEYQKKWREENKEKVSGYGKHYYLKNKEKLKKKSKEYKDKHKGYGRQYYIKHEEEIKEYSKKYRKDNKERIKEQRDKYRKENREEYNKRQKIGQRKRNKRCREIWMPVLRKIFGVLECKICKYSKCFAALDFHHKDQTKKEKGIGNILVLKVTDERIKEVKKCEILCSNCHRELHNGY